MRITKNNETDVLLGELGYDLHEEYEQALALADLDPRVPVLEVATGSGRMAGMLSGLGHSVYSGDISCDALLKMRERLDESTADRITFIPFDAGSIPFADRSFRAVVCANALHEMQDPRLALSEMMRVCAEYGRMLITDFNEMGLDVMSQIHQRIHGRDHNRGVLAGDEVTRILSEGFVDVQERDVVLIHVWVASRKAATSETEL